jgi:hypothetical protein
VRLVLAQEPAVLQQFHHGGAVPDGGLAQGRDPLELPDDAGEPVAVDAQVEDPLDGPDLDRVGLQVVDVPPLPPGVWAVVHPPEPRRQATGDDVRRVGVPLQLPPRVADPFGLLRRFFMALAQLHVRDEQPVPALPVVHLLGRYQRDDPYVGPEHVQEQPLGLDRVLAAESVQRLHDEVRPLVDPAVDH